MLFRKDAQHYEGFWVSVERSVHFLHLSMQKSNTNSILMGKSYPGIAFARIIVAHYHKTAMNGNYPWKLLSQTPSKSNGNPTQAYCACVLGGIAA